MQQQEKNEIIARVNSELEKLVPLVLTNPKEEAISRGNLAVCMIDDEGVVYGKLFGKDRPRMRQSFKIAWTKASQVWLTGVKTGEYERLVFTNQIPENSNGIDNPDLIGWMGGQPLELKNGLKLAVGFSGFTGATDLEIVLQACRNLELI